MDYAQLAQAFAQPPAAYRPMIFWLWNGDLTPAGIEAQIADFAAKGAGGFFIHPMGERFRLKDFVRGMTPPYLSDDYFVLIRHAVQSAQRHGLYAWLYDEGGWPSGTAQGEVVAGHPEFRGQRLHARRLNGLDMYKLPEHAVAALGLPDIGVPVPVDLRELSEGLWPFQELIVFTVEPDGYPVDVLNPLAVRRFIDVTHERYAATVGEFFGSTIPGIFTDETSLGGRLGGDAIPWFGGLQELLTDQMGRDARLYLPLLFAPEQVGLDVVHRYSDHEIVAARCEYYDAVTRRFGESYWRQLSDWCAAHGLIHTGHVGGEDNLPDHLSFGHFFRTTGALHIPGVDVIWRQLFPGQDSFPFPRLASSAMKQREACQPEEGASPTEDLAPYEALRSAQGDKSCHPEEGASPTKDLAPYEALRSAQGDNPWAASVLTETNAVDGFGLHYGQTRWLADYQVQHGVNLYAPMASYYTTAAGRLFGTMSHLGPGNPLWPFYGGFAGYLGRLCLLARRTHEEARVAVYYPIESVWSLDGAPEAWESLRQICETLTRRQIAFDFVDADLLQSLTPDVGRGHCGSLSYQTFIVPASLALPSAALAKLAELREAAARVLLMEHWPLQSADMPGAEPLAQAIARMQEAGAVPVPADELDHELRLLLPDAWLQLAEDEPRLLLTVRSLGDCRLYLLTNDSPQVIEPQLILQTPEPMTVEGWDLRDGEIAVEADLPPLERIELPLVMSPYSTTAFVVRPERPDDTPLGKPGLTPQAREFMRWLADPAARPHRPPHVDVMAEFHEADRARVVTQYLVADGTVSLAPEDELPEPYTDTPAPLWDWQDWPLPDFSGEVTYEFAFTVADELAPRPLLLDLGQVFWAARVELNGEALGDLLWAPYALDLTGRVKIGDNVLRVTVANTLANQVCRPEVEAEARERGWCNAYLERALPMMREDLRSGLVGPVRIIVAEPRTD